MQFTVGYLMKCSNTHRVLYQKEDNGEVVYDAHYFNSLWNKVARFWGHTVNHFGKGSLTKYFKTTDL